MTRSNSSTSRARTRSRSSPATRRTVSTSRVSKCTVDHPVGAMTRRPRRVGRGIAGASAAPRASYVIARVTRGAARPGPARPWARISRRVVATSTGTPAAAAKSSFSIASWAASNGIMRGSVGTRLFALAGGFRTWSRPVTPFGRRPEEHARSPHGPAGSGMAPGNSGTGWPLTTANTDGIDWTWKAAPSCGLASTSTLAARTCRRTLGQLLQDRRRYVARLAPLGPQVDDMGTVIEPLRTSVSEVASVTSTDHMLDTDTVAAPPAPRPRCQTRQIDPHPDA